MSNQPLNPQIVCGIVLEDAKIERADLFSIRRSGPVIFARSVISTVLHDHGGYSFPEIAIQLGRRSHSAIIDSRNRLIKGEFDDTAKSVAPDANDAMDYARWVYNRAYEMSQRPTIGGAL